VGVVFPLYCLFKRQAGVDTVKLRSSFVEKGKAGNRLEVVRRVEGRGCWACTPLSAHRRVVVYHIHCRAAIVDSSWCSSSVACSGFPRLFVRTVQLWQ
jgi:hypothetical protein